MSIRLTKSGYENLQKKIAEKEDELNKLRFYKGNESIHHGDVWHDNFSFEQAEIQERAMMYNIQQMKHELATAIIIDDEEPSEDLVVRVGSKVHVKLTFSEDENDCEEMHLTLSGDIYENLDDNTISVNSPLGICILNQKIGFVGEYSVNGNTITVTILGIENNSV